MRWPKNTRLLVEGAPGPRALRFGTSRQALTKRQLALIRFGDQPQASAALDREGYLYAR